VTCAITAIRDPALITSRACGSGPPGTGGAAHAGVQRVCGGPVRPRWLRRYQGAPGTILGSIPYSVKFLMQNMITMSDNAAATCLFYFGGGCAALALLNTRIPTRHTAVGCQTPTYYGWRNTTTTAADQAAIVRTLAYPGRVLAPDARAYGLHLMESVIPASAGASPAARGAPTARPRTTRTGCPA
jgi:hypothetical protein